MYDYQYNVMNKLLYYMDSIYLDYKILLTLSFWSKRHLTASNNSANDNISSKMHIDLVGQVIII